MRGRGTVPSWTWKHLLGNDSDRPELLSASAAQPFGCLRSFLAARHFSSARVRLHWGCTPYREYEGLPQTGQGLPALVAMRGTGFLVSMRRPLREPRFGAREAAKPILMPGESGGTSAAGRDRTGS